MEQESKQLTGNQSLEIITSMINAAKGDISQASFYFLLWGWVVLLANIGHYVLQEIVKYHAPYLVWLVGIPAGIATALYAYKKGKESSSKSHLNRIYTYVWLSFIVSLIVVNVFFSSPTGQYILNPFILLLAGNATFVSGKTLRFRPLTIGGIMLWVFAIIEFIIRTDPVMAPYQYIVSAIAIIIGYLIPGYILKSKHK